MINNTQKNISSFFTWLIPIILASKIVRWTIMYKKLVLLSIGNGMVERMNGGSYRFGVAVLSEMTNAGNLAENNTGALFRAINFFGIHTTVGWEIYITVLFNILLCFVVKDFYTRTPEAGKKENFFIYLGVAILNIFCFNLAKEPYQMLFFFLMAWAIKFGKTYKQKSYYLAGALLITVLFSRKYYGLILIYYFILQFVVRQLFDNIDFESTNGRKKLITNILITGGIIAVCHFFLLSFLSVSNEDTYTEMMAANYRSMDRASVAESEIVPIFAKGNPFLAAIDYGIKIFRLMFPIELLIKGKVTYIFLVVFQALLAVFIGTAFIKRNRMRKEEEGELEDEDYEEEDDEEEDDEEKDNEDEDDDKEETDDIDEDNEDDEDEEDEEEERIAAFEKRRDRQDCRTAALYLYLAFLLCSAAFEPDFGSWIRHEGITLPVLLLML